VYCLEFDSTRIITGSRDRTVKVWSLATGHLLGTLKGHAGSVLCLKFDKDWEDGDESDRLSELQIKDDGTAKRSSISRGKGMPGFMVSGSSDCSVCVWDLYASYPAHSESGAVGDKQGRGEGQVRGEIRAMLKGHSGGVLDLRIDKWWIVSW